MYYMKIYFHLIHSKYITVQFCFFKINILINYLKARHVVKYL